MDPTEYCLGEIVFSSDRFQFWSQNLHTFFQEHNTFLHQYERIFVGIKLEYQYSVWAMRFHFWQALVQRTCELIIAPSWHDSKVQIIQEAP